MIQVERSGSLKLLARKQEWDNWLEGYANLVVMNLVNGGEDVIVFADRRDAQAVYERAEEKLKDALAQLESEGRT